ncbi:hypothetical protein SBD_7430 [Streptomyces bottropensis ATCC 25435]|uniref:Uncharacterized protein n=1 Tax=Streptomyces bottropensis ATCC 25435 TaxID=1054862 RepID=M3D3M7_9ACTN|nr:hypothetical protein SBD_7430 [Streptomyces bottropensis ATCC 25435]
MRVHGCLIPPSGPRGAFPLKGRSGLDTTGVWPRRPDTPDRSH